MWGLIGGEWATGSGSVGARLLRVAKVSRYYTYVSRYGDTKYDNTRRLLGLLMLLVM